MSLFEDTYFTIGTASEGLFRDKGSKFLAYAYPFKDESVLKDILAQLRELHPKARHYCWAYRMTPDRSVFRFNDDGEPSGTAGRPLLNVLLSKDITNTLIVVVRYFGGTLLGVPGLIHAYKTAALEALANAQIVERTINDVYRIDFDYLQMNDVMRLVKEENLTILNQNFDNRCSMEVEVRKMQVNQFVHKLDNIDAVQYAYLKTL
ncbi:YigZ family protein [Sphingobacterium paludis]|uniref:Putative YigZ family protein n=1 Tax=Sphingobacterium paludis TaxID=1476465 RepID=A0A4R7CWJ3_9SPHI|nr:YigZ family protein [Sphingobacterium paludis]TDS12212.1 putative YigZ family protein [Sphingobacterium paludis]